MNEGVNFLKREFSEHKHKAKRFNPSALPIINELEDVAVKRATGKMSSATAKNKIKACCLKVGINPIEIDQQFFQPNFNFNKNLKMNQKQFKRKNHIGFTSPKPNGYIQRRRALSSFFPATANFKKQQFPALNLQPTKTKGKTKRFEIKPIKLGLKTKTNNSKGFNIKPINLGLNKKKKQKTFIKPIKLGKWF